MYDEQGNLIEEKPIDSSEAEMRKKISIARNKFEDLIQKAKHSDEGIDFLTSSVFNLEAPLDQMVSNVKHTRHEEFESFLGCTIPTEIDIHPPTDIHSRGRSKRIRRSKDDNTGKKQGGKERTPRICKICKQMVFQDLHRICCLCLQIMKLVLVPYISKRVLLVLYADVTCHGDAYVSVRSQFQ